MDIISRSSNIFFLDSDDEYFDAEDGEMHASGKSSKGSELKKAPEAPNEELINILLKFEVKEVCTFVLLICKYNLVILYILYIVYFFGVWFGIKQSFILTR